MILLVAVSWGLDRVSFRLLEFGLCFFYFSYLKFGLLLWNIDLILMFWHGNSGKRTHASTVDSFLIDH